MSIEKGEKGGSERSQKETHTRITGGENPEAKSFQELSKPKEQRHEDTFTLAKAVVVRNYKEYEREKAFFSPGKGRSEAEEIRGADLHARAIEGFVSDCLKRSPQPLPTQALTSYMQDAMIHMSDQTVIDSLLSDSKQKTLKASSASPFSPDSIKRIKQNYIAERQRDEEVGSDIRPEIFEALKTVKDVAREYAVSPEQVYSNDNLYEELVNRTYTPEQYGWKIVYRLDEYTPETILKSFVRYDIRKEAIANGQGDIVEETLDYTTNQRMKGLDQAFLAGFDQDCAAFKNDALDYCKAQIIRFWGRDALHYLPEALREKLRY